jgi:hypothetical protein
LTPALLPHVDFTVRSAEVARAFTDGHGVPSNGRELIANAIAMHHTPGASLESGAEAFLLSAGAGVDVFGLRSHEVPDAVRRSVVREYPRLGFKREFAGLWRAEARAGPSRPRVVPAPVRADRPDHPPRTVPQLNVSGAARPSFAVQSEQSTS